MIFTAEMNTPKLNLSPVLIRHEVLDKYGTVEMYTLSLSLSKNV
jgi:hypothetical protein